jgi:pimeloyl-ACP methyl ester carboxylesterase
MSKVILYIAVCFSFILFSCSSNSNSKLNLKKEISGGQTGESRIKDKNKDEITINASGDVKIAADYYYESGRKESPGPLVILIHQFRSTKEQWSSAFIDSLLHSGFKVLAYDIRGHGKSSKVDYELSELLVDPEKAPYDLKAVFGWTKLQNGIDTTRIAVVGASIGGSLACYARYHLGAKTIVGISNGKATFENFMQIDERMMGRVFLRISSVLFIVGSRDKNYKAEQDYLYENFLDDPKEVKVYDSDKHGKFLIEEFPAINTEILNWLKKYL